MPAASNRRARRAFAVTVATLAIASYVRVSLAQGFPERPIHIVVGFPAGNTLDVVARVAAEHLRVKLGQPVIVDNKPGANGLIAAAEVARAPADGYTLLASNSSGMTVNPQIYRKAGYRLGDFRPITMITSAPLILVVNPANDRTASVRTVSELVALAKSRPGDLRYGSGGPGNITGLSFELLGNAAGFKATHVPYKGTNAAELGLLGKEVDALLDTPVGVPLVKSGKLTALAVTSKRRWRDLPDVRTLQEAGYREIDVTFWLALMAPANTPDGVVDRLYAALRTMRDDPNTVRQLEPHGDVELAEPNEFDARLRAESSAWGEVIRRENIQLD